MLIHHNETEKTPSHKANMLNTFCHSVFTKDDENLVQLPRKPSIVEDVNLIVMQDGVLKLLNEIDTVKSCGPECITGIHLKAFSNVIATSLTLQALFLKYGKKLRSRLFTRREVNTHLIIIDLCL